MGGKEEGSRAIQNEHHEDSLMTAARNSLSTSRPRYGTFWGSMLVLLFFAILFMAAFSITPNRSVNYEVLFSFALNGVIGLLALLQAIRKRAYSLAIMHWTFFLLFFVFAPVIQYIWGHFPWSFGHSDNSIIFGNALLSIWGIIIWILQSVTSNGVSTKLRRADWLSASQSVPIVALNILIIFSVLIMAYMITTVGFSDLFSRSTNELTFDSSSIRQIVEKTSRATVTFTLIACIIRYRTNKDCVLQLALAFIICLITCFPAGMPRYSAAAIWGSIAIIAFPIFKEKKILFPSLFIIAFLIIFPAINVYKGTDFATGNLVAASLSVLQNFFQTFLEVSYDAYSMYLRAILYVSDGHISWGYQFLGVLFFFVPRAMWPSKPFGSGATIALAQGQSVTNVSCPLPAEAIINFGIAGLVVVAFLVGWMIRAIDDKYWRGGELSLFATVTYPQLLFFFFFMMRGDLLSSFAYTIAFAVTNLILATCCRFAADYQRRRRNNVAATIAINAR